MADVTKQMAHVGKTQQMPVDTVKKPAAEAPKAPANEPATPKKATPQKPTGTKTSSKKSSGSSMRYYKPLANKATSTQANRTILLAVGTGVGVILIARVAGTPGVQRLNSPGQLIKISVGTGATVIALMVMAEVAPDVAIALAWLICIGAILTYGVDFARALAKGTLNPGIPLTPFGTTNQNKPGGIAPNLRKPTSSA